MPVTNGHYYNLDTSKITLHPYPTDGDFQSNVKHDTADLDSFIKGVETKFIAFSVDCHDKDKGQETNSE